MAAGVIEHISPTPFKDVHAAMCPPRVNSARRVKGDHKRTVPSLENDARRGEVALLLSNSASV